MIKKNYPAITPEKKTMMKKLSQQAKSRIFTLKKSLCIEFDHSSRIPPNYVYIIERINFIQAVFRQLYSGDE